MTQGHDPPDDGDQRARARRDTALGHHIQDHLGRKLRTTLTVAEQKPAFLGDSALPPRFEGLVRQLERNERPAQAGLDAVRRALDLPPDEAS